MTDFIVPAFFLAPFLLQDGFAPSLLTAASVYPPLTLPSTPESEPLAPPFGDLKEEDAFLPPQDTTGSILPPPLPPSSEPTFQWWIEV